MNPVSLAVLQNQLTNVIQTSYAEGVLDCQFAELQALQDQDNPNFVTELITLFCSDTEKMLTEMRQHLSSNTNIDFSKMKYYCHQLKGSSSCIGAHRMKLACTRLREVCDARNTERFLRTANELRDEYCYLKTKFQTLVQIQKKISAIETHLQNKDRTSDSTSHNSSNCCSP